MNEENSNRLERDLKNQDIEDPKMSSEEDTCNTDNNYLLSSENSANLQKNAEMSQKAQLSGQRQRTPLQNYAGKLSEKYIDQSKQLIQWTPIPNLAPLAQNFPASSSKSITGLEIKQHSQFDRLTTKSKTGENSANVQKNAEMSQQAQWSGQKQRSDPIQNLSGYIDQSKQGIQSTPIPNLEPLAQNFPASSGKSITDLEIKQLSQYDRLTTNTLLCSDKMTTDHPFQESGLNKCSNPNIFKGSSGKDAHVIEKDNSYAPQNNYVTHWERDIPVLPKKCSGFAIRSPGGIESFSSTAASFIPSFQESCSTNEVIYEFKPLTTGDFMLTLKCENFQEIPSEILKDQRCKHCTKIDISGNKLKKIPMYLDIDHFPSLKNLDASKNKLLDLPGIQNFRSMENLDISHNRFHIFPLMVSTLNYLKGTLKVLKVNGNRIRNIPTELGLCKTLEILRLEENKLKYIPEDICLLGNLQYLNISKNKIKTIPLKLYLNENLKVVAVDGNPIIEPSPDILAKPIQEIRRFCKGICGGKLMDDRIVALILGASGSGRSTVCSALFGITEKEIKSSGVVKECTAVIRDITITLRVFLGAQYSDLAELFCVQNALYFVTVNLEDYSVNVNNCEWFDKNVGCYFRNIADNQTVFLIGTKYYNIAQASTPGKLLTTLMEQAESALKDEKKMLNLVSCHTEGNTAEDWDFLKDEIVRHALDPKLFPDRGHHRPIKWKETEHALNTYRAADQKSSLWLPIETVKDVVTAYGFSHKEMERFLHYLCSVGSIIWHDKLQDFVCVDPCKLIKLINVILRKYTQRSLEGVPAYMNAWQMYSTRGCKSMELIRWIQKGISTLDIDITIRALENSVCYKVELLTPRERQWPQLGHHATVARKKLIIKLPTWKELETSSMYYFPCLFEDRETKMIRYCKDVRKLLLNNCQFRFSFRKDHGKTIKNLFLKCSQIVMESTVSHQIWNNGILSEGVEQDDTGVLYYFQFSDQGTDITMSVNVMSNRAISEYCKVKIKNIFDKVNET